MAHLPEGHLLGCGNPLLDIQAVVDKVGILKIILFKTFPKFIQISYRNRIF